MERTWLDELAGEQALSPVAKEPDMTKEAALVMTADPEAMHELNQNVRSLQARKEQILSAITNGIATDGERAELETINRELDEMLENRHLFAEPPSMAMASFAALSLEEKGQAVEAFSALVSTSEPGTIKQSLLQMYPTMTDVEFEEVKQAYWKPVFGGQKTHEIAHTVITADANEMGEILDAVIEKAAEEKKLCKKCETPLNSAGMCSDITCPFSDHPQSTDLETLYQPKKAFLKAFVKKAYPLYGQDDNLVDALISEAVGLING